jgi:hypothetical protein
MGVTQTRQQGGDNKRSVFSWVMSHQRAWAAQHCFGFVLRVSYVVGQQAGGGGHALSPLLSP